MPQTKTLARPAQRRLETRVLQATRDPHTRGLGLAIEQHATWRLDSAAQGAEWAHAVQPPAFYTRWGNPTTQRLERAVAALEGGEMALATGSGMGAISTVILHAARKKKHVVAQRSLYTATTEMFTRLMADYGVRTDQVAGPDTDAFARSIKKDTGLVYLESPSNPLMEISDIKAVCDIAADKGVPVAVDNTFASPVNQRPLALGASVSIHSATKYLGGHSDVTGGVLVGDTETVTGYWETYKLLGPTIAPNDAFLIHRGIKTLALRVERQNQNALAVARFLADHDAVSAVYHPGLPDHPGHAVAKRQMPGGFGGMVSFEVAGGYDAAARVLEATQVCILGVSLGGVETLIQHPASISHGPLNEEERKVAAIPSGLIRLSVGIEHVDDLTDDLGQALEHA